MCASAKAGFFLGTSDMKVLRAEKDKGEGADEGEGLWRTLRFVLLTRLSCAT